jgi:hypothetical protein
MMLSVVEHIIFAIGRLGKFIVICSLRNVSVNYVIASTASTKYVLARGNEI